MEVVLLLVGFIALVFLGSLLLKPVLTVAMLPFAFAQEAITNKDGKRKQAFIALGIITGIAFIIYLILSSL